MGKGKHGCSQPIGEALSDAADKQLIAYYVELGDTQSALDYLLSDQVIYQTAYQWMSELIDEAQDAELVSRYRHLQAALLFDRSEGDPLLLDRAARVLLADIDDEDTDQSFRDMAELKLDAIRAERHQIRLSPDGSTSDHSLLAEARLDQRSVLIETSDPGREVAMLESVFGRSQLLVLPGTPARLDDRELIGYGSSVGIGYIFHPGPLLEAMQQGKVLVVPPGMVFHEDTLFRLTAAAQVGRFLDIDGREHKASLGFMVAGLVRPGDQLGQEADSFSQKHDFSSWV